MEIQNEFTVKAPIQETWEALLDVPGIALCLPGAELTGVEDDIYSGTVKVKVGPITTQYSGSARFIERDVADYRARIEAKGSEIRGAGTANALVTTSLTDCGEHTSVSVHTDLTITGKVAQFGRGMIGEIAGNLLSQFSANLEARLQQPVEATSSATTSGGEAPQEQPAPAPVGEAPGLKALDLVSGPLLKRLGPPIGVAALVYVAYRLAWGRRRTSMPSNSADHRRWANMRT